MKLKVIIGVAAIIGFTSLLMVNFGNSISTYTNFKAAKNDGTVHVVGTWKKSKPSGFSVKKKQFTFYMKDQKGDVRKVVYPKPEPNNFEKAKKLVVTGQMHHGVFYASDMLMKCPSKYQATPKEVKAQSAKGKKASLY
ncbi:MAG TPA: cytochrome c maturation protein CcmE [Balneolaceae bacterium]|nr:cytochrome c maturation protein CcmE [Balneolaceae bacterium]